MLGEVWRLLQSPTLDPAVARASFYLAAAAARGSPAVRKQLVAQVSAAIAAADEAAAASGPLGKSPRRSAATDWDLQHTAFATCRLAGAATGADEISRSFGVGVGSGDAVGARHALAMGVDVALRVGGLAGAPLLLPLRCCLLLLLVAVACCWVQWIRACKFHTFFFCRCRMLGMWCVRCTKRWLMRRSSTRPAGQAPCAHLVGAAAGWLGVAWGGGRKDDSQRAAAEPLQWWRGWCRSATLWPLLPGTRG